MTGRHYLSSNLIPDQQLSPGLCVDSTRTNPWLELEAL